MENLDDIKQWIEKNLVRQADAHLITGQTAAGLKQSVRRGKINPFVELKLKNSEAKTALFLREDLENYAYHLSIKKNI